MLRLGCPCRHRQPVKSTVPDAAAASSEKSISHTHEEKEKPFRFSQQWLSKQDRPHLYERLEEKGYAEILVELEARTALNVADLDPKALQLLDAIHEAGKAATIFKQLRQTLDGIPRQRIGNWRRYFYSLLRSLAPQEYQSLKDGGDAHKQGKSAKKPPKPEKAKTGGEKKKSSPVSNFDFSKVTSVAEFVPSKAVDDGMDANISSEMLYACFDDFYTACPPRGGMLDRGWLPDDDIGCGCVETLLQALTSDEPLSPETASTASS